MAKKPDDPEREPKITTERERSLIPFTVEQNPAPPDLEGQQTVTQVQALTDQILDAFKTIKTASNYVSTQTGPYYVNQFQAFAEQLARIQITASETHIDSQIDFTRPEYLWETIGTLVFPIIGEDGIPQIDGDFRYRCFLKEMIFLLLTGATAQVQKEGVELLTEALVSVLVKVDFANDPITAWGFGEQFEFEINVSGKTTWTNPATGELEEGDFGTGFPKDPFILQKNVAIVLEALKPAHTLYDYRNLFFECLEGIVKDEDSYEMCNYYYDDFRKFCEGAKEIASEDGVTLSNRNLFSDVTVDFRNIIIGATLEILTGPNASMTNGGIDQFNGGRYRVTGRRRFISGAEMTSREYTTSPTGLSGIAIMGEDGVLTDETQDWSLAVEGEALTIEAGPNMGTYRLETLLGNNGGPVGLVPPGSGVTRVRVALCILEVDDPMPSVAQNQEYTVGVQRLGCRVPQIVEGEDVSMQFYL